MADVNIANTGFGGLVRKADNAILLYVKPDKVNNTIYCNRARRRRFRVFGVYIYSS